MRYGEQTILPPTSSAASRREFSPTVEAGPSLMYRSEDTFASWASCDAARTLALLRKDTFIG